jgi:predicted small lipoprotein YifL
LIKIPHAKLVSAKAGAFAVVLWVAAAVMVWGCGKKGPPEPPSGDKPPEVNDLAYSVSDSTIKLSWTIPPTTEKAQTPVAGFLIYEYKQPTYERECSNCPIIFEKIGEVAVRSGGRGQPEPQPLVFVQSIEPGYRYIFKVKAYNDEGVASKDSNFVELRF